MQHSRYTLCLPSPPHVASQSLLERAGIQRDDQLPPHQEPLYQKPRQHKSICNHCDGSVTPHSSAGRGSVCCSYL
ncbi:hypothetical protein CSPAE12_09417 [Colletotrichum incanum]|nr:hypothetical protein CSPAE12_09417 [Colletotrichum incanum]